MNGDGRLDIVTGSYDGRPYLTLATASGWAEPEMARKEDGGELILGMYWDYEGDQWRNRTDGAHNEAHGTCAAPVDWDGDGDYDLLIGAGDGAVYWWQNVGGPATPPIAPDAAEVTAGGEALRAGAGYATPTAADWDQDGRWDLVYGNDDGAVAWARNTGEAGSPRFAAPTVLLEATQSSTTRSGASAQVAVADLNGDGLVDLIVGDNQDLPVGDGMTEEQAARFEELSGQFAEFKPIMDALYGDDDSAREAVTPEQEQALEALIEEYSSLMPQSDSHGWVWFYPRTTSPPA